MGSVQDTALDTLTKATGLLFSRYIYILVQKNYFQRCYPADSHRTRATKAATQQLKLLQAESSAPSALAAAQLPRCQASAAAASKQLQQHQPV